MARDVARPEGNQPDHGPNRQRDENHDEDAQCTLVAAQFVGIHQRLRADI